jgi:hypothetical protein
MLQEMIQAFADKWAPRKPEGYHKFVDDLRSVLEAYGRAALRHESLPDTEHEHGDPA